MMQLLAEEMDLRAQTGGLDLIPPHQISKAAYGLSQTMRSDAPWPDLLVAMGDAMMQNQEEVLAGEIIFTTASP